MDHASKEDLASLLEARGGLCVSIYMPTHVGAAAQQDQIRLKNLFKKAQQKLAARGMPKDEIEELLGPARKLAVDDIFLRRPAGGLAIFAERGALRRYQLLLRCAELVLVSDRYHIKPLLVSINRDGRFYVLALSQSEVRLLRCSATAAVELPLTDMPLSLGESMSQVDAEKQLQFHTAGSPARGGARPALFHGHGRGKDQAKERILRFFQQVDRGLRDALRGEQAPLVVAAVDYLHPIYKQANSYANLVDQGMLGNPEEWAPEELRRRAWELVHPLLARRRQRALARYRELEGTALGASELGPIVASAHEGRIDVLFIARGVQRWGTFNESTSELQLCEDQRTGAQEVLDLAVVRTLINGGTAYALRPDEMPGRASAVALLRY